MKTPCLLATTLLMAASPAHAAKPVFETHSCDYTDLSRDVTYSGRCHKQQTEINGHFAYILTWPSGGRVTVEFVNAQSGNHIWKLNGKAAVAVEISREQLKGFSLDLNQMLEWQDRP